MEHEEFQKVQLMLRLLWQAPEAGFRSGEAVRRCPMGWGLPGMCGVAGGVQGVEPARKGAEASDKETPSESRHLKSISFPLFLIKGLFLPVMHVSFVRVSFVRGWNILLN